MSTYELTLILNDEKEVEGIKKTLESLSGKLVEEQKWGKKELAYPIKKNITADYYHWKFEIDRKNLLELKKKLNFNEKLIRYLLLVAE